MARIKQVFVVMASYLGPYAGCASNRPEKFIRAVDSFLSNTYPNKKLVIVSDGCEETVRIYEDQYKNNDEVICLPMLKQELFSGAVRNRGLEVIKCISNDSEKDVVCYLDSDDTFGKNHLKVIAENFLDDFVIYDTYRAQADGTFSVSEVSMGPALIGTSSFAHRAGMDVVWPTGYGHDWELLVKLSANYKYNKIDGCQYYIHHTPAVDI